MEIYEEEEFVKIEEWLDELLDDFDFLVFLDKWFEE